MFLVMGRSKPSDKCKGHTENLQIYVDVYNWLIALSESHFLYSKEV